MTEQKVLSFDQEKTTHEKNQRFRLSDFEKVAKIGEGTFGKVYKAQFKDPACKKISFFALKKLNMIIDEKNDQGFPITSLREIMYLQTLDHPNIVRIR